MASTPMDCEDPNNEHRELEGNHMNENGFITDTSPASNIVIPETPSPSMPKKKVQHQPRTDTGFDIAESIFADLPSHKIKTSKKKLDKELRPSASSNIHLESGRANKTVQPVTSHPKVMSSSVGQNSSSDKTLKKQYVSSDKHEVSKTMDSSSSSDDDNDISLFQRIKKKRKIDKRNGSLFGSNVGELSIVSVNSETTKNHIGSSRKHIEQPTSLPKHGSNKIKNASDSKGIKLISEPFARREFDKKTSNIKETVVRKHPTTKVQSSSKRKSNLPTRFCRDNESQGTADVNSAISKQSGLERLKKSQSSSHSTNSQSSLPVSNTQNSCMLQSKVYESDPGPATSKGSKVKNKKKSPPGNTVRDSKNNVIQRRIKDLFGSDTESEGDILETEERVRARNSQQTSPNRSSSGNDASIKKKNKSTSRKTACNSDKDSQSNRHSSCHNKLQGHLNERGEAFVRDFRQSTSAGSDSNRSKKTKKSKPCPIVSDDSTDTEPEVSLLTARPAVVRNKCNSPERKARHVVETRNESSHSDDSDVEMMSAKESPEKSPVFNRAVTPPLRRMYEERRGGDRQSSNSNSTGSRVSRTSKVNNRRRIAEEHASSDSDVVPVDDEVELVSPHGLSRRHGHEVALGRNSIHFGAELSRRVGGSSELGSPIDLGSIMRVSSSDLSRPGPSFHQERRRRKRPSRGAGNHERTSRGSSSTAETQQRQLEADEQLARDLASGKISTPISDRKIKRKGSKSSSRRNRQMAEDEALARELASGNIRTPVDQQRPSQQIDDDEALARQLQEQFNAEAMEEPQEDETDTASNTLSINIPGQHPFTFHYEMGISPFPRPYPTVNPVMEPVVMGELPDSPPRTRRRGRSRGRGGRGRRGRNSGSVHIQFFPMDASLDSDYESLWELADRVGPAVQQGLSAEVLSLLPTFTYKASEENQGKNCTICMMDYEQGDDLRRLPCFHDYHTTCIDRWLAENSACPVCQTRVTLDDQVPE